MRWNIKRNQHPSQAPIAVVERVERLEFNMQERELNERVRFGGATKVAFPFIHPLCQVFRRDRRKTGLLNRATLGADPILICPVATRGFIPSANTLHQQGMGGSQHVR